MKVEVFKKLIKEAVREVLQEELGKGISTAAVGKVTKYENYKPTTSAPARTGDPIMDLLSETKASMGQVEYRDLVNATSNMVSAPGIGRNLTTEHFNSGPEPGLDISQFDFMMRAGDVYKASVEKDKIRLGG